MQDPRLTQRSPSTEAYLCAYAASSFVATIFLVQAGCMLNFMAVGVDFKRATISEVPQYAFILSIIVGSVAALPTMGTLRALRRVGNAYWRRVVIVGVAIGAASFLLFLKLPETSNLFAQWPNITKPPDGAIPDLLGIAIFIGALSGIAAGSTYGIITRPRQLAHPSGLHPS